LRFVPVLGNLGDLARHLLMLHGMRPKHMLISKRGIRAIAREMGNEQGLRITKVDQAVFETCEKMVRDHLLCSIKERKAAQRGVALMN